MKKTEYYATRADGVVLVISYSDQGFYLIQDGTDAIYDIAIDPEDSGRTYTETNDPIENQDATIEDYEAALHDLGVL